MGAPSLWASIRRIFFPSTLPDFQAKHEKFCQEGESLRKELQREIDQVRALLQQLDSERSALVDSGCSPHDFAENLRVHSVLKSHFENVKVELAQAKDKYRTAACYQESGYRGVPDWAEKSLAKYADLCDSIGTASVFGAGITYTTIFSAPRGNLSLMCWSFALFDVGFIIAMLVQTILKWASRLPLPEKQFATTRYWDLVIDTALIIAFGSASVAIFLLNLTIFQLVFPEPAQDTVQLNTPPAPSAIFSISILAGSIFTVVVILILSNWADGPKRARRHDATTIEWDRYA
ncbi:hypothetical protein BOTBODRAFT_178890 [Botryobasidium botryosum FD-172 SS1]|uniref:Uncharacterized protein n=1 Tax=Botryobasidium botryosum (strain FD-172 SS1) TaxID=930990 RepID=A0A067M4N5_BOTB1|nr:hypothetical protein BOTBODRAFT_178890 [Botryobasidium botryosum FD-172 SS1]